MLGFEDTEIIKRFMREAHEASARLQEELEREEREHADYEAHKHLYTPKQISQATGLSEERVMKALRAAEEDEFYSMPHPEEPETTVYGLREHMEPSPGSDLRPSAGH